MGVIKLEQAAISRHKWVSQNELGDTVMQLSFSRFMIVYVILVAVGSVSTIAYLQGMLNEILPYLLCGFYVFLVSLLFNLAIAKSKRVGTKRVSAKELQREDDALLQVVAFSQSILFLIVTLTMKEEISKLVLSVLIAASAVIFFSLRTWAKIKNSAKYRYYSMVVLALVIANNVFGLLGAVTYHYIRELSLAFPSLNPLGSLTIMLVIYVSTIELFVTYVRSVFKKRYGYSQN